MGSLDLKVSQDHLESKVFLVKLEQPDLLVRLAPQGNKAQPDQLDNKEPRVNPGLLDKTVNPGRPGLKEPLDLKGRWDSLVK